jgi:hypothetical protein
MSKAENPNQGLQEIINYAKIIIKQIDNEVESEKLAANRKHCAKINNEAMQNLNLIILEGMKQNDAPNIGKKIIEAIAKGEVPHVSIEY